MAIGKGIVKCGRKSKSHWALCFFLLSGLLLPLSLYSETVYALPESDMIELEQIFSELETTIEQQRTTLDQLSETIETQRITLQRQSTTIDQQADRLREAEQSLTEYEQAVRFRAIATATGSGVLGLLLGALIGAVVF